MSLHKTKEEDYSKNKRAKKLLGKRLKGQPLFSPPELGYACPICGNWGDSFSFSEYDYMMWCDRCNIDIPSCLCKKYPEPHLSGLRVLTKKERIIENTRIFLDIIEEIKDEGKA